MNPPPEAIAAKAASEQTIQELGGKVLETLPWLDRSEPRSQEDAVARALVMNALLQIYFGAPTSIIRDWITRNGLDAALSNGERELIAKKTKDLSEREKKDLYWYLEAIWAFAWTGSLIDAMPIDEAVGANLASMMPNLQRNEDGSRLRASYRLRPFEELYRMLDLYYRAHWCARNGQLTGEETGGFELDRIMERRKALEWLCDRKVQDWDDTPCNT